MEAVIFVGLQASGKSTFYRERFSRTHVRINLDMLKTRHRETLAWRAEVLHAARSCGLPWREDWITPAQLEAADELFLTNSIIGVWPVRTLATRSYAIGQATHAIQKTIEAAQCFAPAA